MAILPLYGHQALRARLSAAVARGTLPASLLIHGPAGVGKQRLALWLAQLLLCNVPGDEPCGRCRSCEYVGLLAHPDLRWYFPRPRLKDADVSSEDVKDDYAGELAKRSEEGGVYKRPSGSEGIFVQTVRTIVQEAARTPSLGSRKVFVIGDAERMVPQESSPEAANAFLKLLEEPLADTTVILTSSEPGALLPTIRSRVVSLRASPLNESEMRQFLGDPLVRQHVGDRSPEQIRLARGAPGALVSVEALEQATTAAREFLAAALGSRRERMRGVLRMGGSRARGFFSDMLDALTTLLHEHAQRASDSGDSRRALGAARVLVALEEAKLRAGGNVNPQLISASLAREIASALR